MFPKFNVDGTSSGQGWSRNRKKPILPSPKEGVKAKYLYFLRLNNWFYKLTGVHFAPLCNFYCLISKGVGRNIKAAQIYRIFMGHHRFKKIYIYRRHCMQGQITLEELIYGVWSEHKIYFWASLSHTNRFRA